MKNVQIQAISILYTKAFFDKTVRVVEHRKSTSLQRHCWIPAAAAVGSDIPVPACDEGQASELHCF